MNPSRLRVAGLGFRWKERAGHLSAREDWAGHIYFLFYLSYVTDLCVGMIFYFFSFSICTYQTGFRLILNEALVALQCLS